MVQVVQVCRLLFQATSRSASVALCLSFPKAACIKSDAIFPRQGLPTCLHDAARANVLTCFGFAHVEVGGVRSSSAIVQLGEAPRALQVRSCSTLQILWSGYADIPGCGYQVTSSCA